MSNPPSTLGQYQIIREIARSNDIVYEAYDPLMNRRVAIKELAVPNGVTAQQRDERISRFKREAQAAGTLAHPNIMTVFSIAQDADRFYMAMEYLDGNTLRNEIDNKVTIPMERAVEILAEVLSGLDHAHSKGVIHRDIKPDNVQILSGGQIKITDFGIARLTFQPNLTIDGQVFGTPSYMSPEQVVGKDIDCRSDIFSVGTMFYEMISGRKPFMGDSVVSITYAIMNKAPEILPAVPHAIWRVINKALDKTPHLRYSGANDMRLDLLHALELSRNPQSTTSQVPNMYNYQATPPPVPVVHYQSTPPPFDPYGTGAVNPQQLAYFQSAQPGQQPQPLPSYPYNPYSNQQAGNMPPHTPGYGQPIPIFYPPPPRKPLIKPEAVDFFRKLILAILVFGTLIGVLLFGLSELSQAMQRMRAESDDRANNAEIVVNNPTIPLQNRINESEQRLSQVKSEKVRREAGPRLSELYFEQAAMELSQRNASRAEENLKRSIELDKTNSKALVTLALVYEQQTQQLTDPSQIAELWRKAGENWQQAKDNSTELSNQRKFGESAAEAFYNFAQTARDAGYQPGEIRQQLYEARRNVEPGSSLDSRIQTLINSLR